MLSACGGEKEASREGGRELSQDSPLLGTQKRWQTTFMVQPDVGEVLADLDEEDALAATGIPALREVNGSAYLIAKYAKEYDSNNGIWEVTCYWDSAVPASAPTFEYWWESETVEKVIMQDQITGLPICNSVGEPLLLTRPIELPVLVVEKIQTSFDPDVILNFSNRTNKSPFCGAPAGCALMGRIQDSPEYQGGLTLRRVRYNVKFDLSISIDSSGTATLKGWIVDLLNHGTKYAVPIIGGTAETPDGRTITVDETILYANFTDLHMNPTTGNLELDGSKRDPALPGIYLPFNRYPQAEFNELSIDPYA